MVVEAEVSDTLDVKSSEIVPSTENKKVSKKRSRDEEDAESDSEDDPMDGEGMAPTFSTSANPELTASLPFFPLPALPNAPSKSLLALQGLDQALVDAELVSPSSVLPIPSEKDDGGTRLSERMRKRLRDLGITELFAGMSCVSSLFFVTIDTVFQCKRLCYRFFYQHTIFRMPCIFHSILVVTFASLHRPVVVKRWHMQYQL